MIGAGRLGRAMVAGLRAAGIEIAGPLGRGADGEGYDAVLLCVPDGEIAAAAALIKPGRLVGHCSGATGLEPLAPHESFSLHPLMTVTGEGASFQGAGAAVAGSSPAALALARMLADRLGMQAVEVSPQDRPAYHAAASMASNFLVTLEAAAERLAVQTGVQREMLVPLVRATVENWAQLGGARALTGPVADRAPDLLELFDALVHATAALAERPLRELEAA